MWLIILAIIRNGANTTTYNMKMLFYLITKTEVLSTKQIFY